MATKLFTLLCFLPRIIHALTCSPSSIALPSLPAAQILNLTANPVCNYSIAIPEGVSHFAINVTSLDFCNVTITYTHPGQDDTIHVYIWLPSTWNGRFMGTGGGGFSAGGTHEALGLAASEGYAAAGTDAGHSNADVLTAPWAQISPGNVNLYLLQDFASVAFKDLTILGKAITESFYAMAPKYSYWNGCSTGGRQGLMLAQRYPESYDGILAAAPAINWVKFVVSEYWPQFVMNQLGEYPSSCELDAITAAAITECDNLDGVTDGIISRPDLCDFNASSVVGQTASCSDGSTTKISAAAAKVARETWAGPTSSTGQFLWYGLLVGSPLTGLAGTTCGNGTCKGAPFPIEVDWITQFVKKNSSFDVSTITHREFDSIFHASVQQFTSFIGTDDPDLSEFRAAGGKLISWHGLADQLIPPGGTVDYYQRVQELDPQVRDFFRFFEAPGIEHCQGGLGAFPGYALDALVKWVENGTAPETLLAQSTEDSGEVKSVELCQWPLVQAYKGGDPNVAASYTCEQLEPRC